MFDLGFSVAELSAARMIGTAKVIGEAKIEIKINATISRRLCKISPPGNLNSIQFWS
jgi:hypothetical protein